MFHFIPLSYTISMFAHNNGNATIGTTMYFFMPTTLKHPAIVKAQMSQVEALLLADASLMLRIAPA